MSKHTEGPWEVIRDNEGLLSYADSELVRNGVMRDAIQSASDDEFTVALIVGDINAAEANAALISAAPDMLEALLLADEISRIGILNATAEQLSDMHTLRRAAIAKATLTRKEDE